MANNNSPDPAQRLIDTVLTAYYISVPHRIEFLATIEKDIESLYFSGQTAVKPVILMTEDDLVF